MEDLLQSEKAPAPAFLLYARLLLKTREIASARQAYQQAVGIDPTLADPALAEQLNLRPESARPGHEEMSDDLLRAPVEYPGAAPITEVEKIIVRIENLGPEHALSGLAADLKDKVMACKNAIDKYQEAIRSQKLAEADEEIAKGWR